MLRVERLEGVVSVSRDPRQPAHSRPAQAQGCLWVLLTLRLGLERQAGASCGQDRSGTRPASRAPSVIVTGLILPGSPLAGLSVAGRACYGGRGRARGP